MPTRRPTVVEEALAPVVLTHGQLSMVLPLPPSINHQYATVNNRRVLTAVGRRYKALVAQHLWVSLRQPHRAPVSVFWADPQVRLALSIWFRFSSPLRRDIDGGLKIAQDALCEALGINDNRIAEVHLYKQVDPASPSITLTLSPVSPPVE